MEGASEITAVELKSLDGTPATSPSLYDGAKGGGNSYDRQGCSRLFEQRLHVRIVQPR